MAVHINGATGEVLGSYDTYERAEGWLPWTLALMENIHLCGLTCEDYPGYQSWLLKDVPYMDWAGFEEDGEVYPITLGWPAAGHHRAAAGLPVALRDLAVVADDQAVLPRRPHPLGQGPLRPRLRPPPGRRHDRAAAAAPVGAHRHELRVRLRREGLVRRHARRHGGVRVRHRGARRPETAEDITLDEAIVAAQEEFDTTEQPVFYELPVVDDPTGFYGIWFSDGLRPVGRGCDPGRRAGARRPLRRDQCEIVYGIPGEPVAQTLYQDFNYPVHSGYFVNGWLRIPWLVLGLVPLLLAWTGVSTWLFKRTVRKRRKRGAKALAAAMMSGALTSAVVIYLGVVALLAVPPRSARRSSRRPDRRRRGTVCAGLVAV